MTEDVEQRTDDWFAARLGKVTASKIADVMAKTRTGWGASRANYAAQLVCERLTGVRGEGFTNAAMQWGSDTEPQARAFYELETGTVVAECGFFDHPSIAMTGASPDGLVGDDGLVEIKCPNSATHIATLRGEPIADKYIKQMQWQMACTGRQWCDFASFDPRLPDAMQLHVQRVARDDALIAGIEAAVSEFLADVAATVADLEARYLKEAA
ncbi:MAG TPA: YqaJ viral recombinase family protein [Sphingopyxis sp.]|nr:YqaJ viral recombinase family protein [Sphingopyxis sp.]HMP45906.1 YqaJ viral recombinase family protein [Sphingopyxis sp.]